MPFDSDDVVTHLREHAGDSLRAVVVYNAGQHRDLYRRADVADLHGSDLEATIVDEFRAEPRSERGANALGHQGELRATVRLYDGRAVLHLPRDEESGTLVVLDTAAAADLAGFVADLRADLYGE
jgi:hypothetical protein